MASASRQGRPVLGPDIRAFKTMGGPCTVDRRVFFIDFLIIISGLGDDKA